MIKPIMAERPFIFCKMQIAFKLLILNSETDQNRLTLD